MSGIFRNCVAIGNGLGGFRVVGSGVEFDGCVALDNGGEGFSVVTPRQEAERLVGELPDGDRKFALLQKLSSIPMDVTSGLGLAAILRMIGW